MLECVSQSNILVSLVLRRKEEEEEEEEAEEKELDFQTRPLK